MWRQLATRRRAGLAVVLGVLLSGALTPAAAQVALYEDWAAERIDPARWRPSSLSSAAYEVVRLISGGQLLQGLRVYGAPRNDLGTQSASNVLGFALGDFTAVQWDMAVQSYLLQGCSTGFPPSALQIGMQMLLFNDGSSPGAGDATGNVDARLLLARASDSSAAPQVLEARALVTRCNVPDCSTRAMLGPVTMGEVLLGQLNTFRIIWDAPGNQVVFQRNADPQVVLPYVVPVVTPLRGGRMWTVTGIGANCTASPRPFAEVFATLDNIFVISP
jgi:hypothetical protein